MKAPEAALDEAVSAWAADEIPGRIVTGWVVVASTVANDAGEEVSGIATILPGGSMPWTATLGLIEAARLRLHADFLSE